MKNAIAPVSVLIAAGLVVSFVEPDLRGSVFPILAIIASLAVYFLPTIVALARSHPATTPILLLNLFLGWTLLGWVAALVWSAMPIQPRTLSLTERALIERNISDQLSL